MELRIHFVINCVIFIPYLLAKPFSLNKAIAEELRSKQSLHTTPRTKSADKFHEKIIDKPLQEISTIAVPPIKYKVKEHSAATKDKPVIYRKAFKIIKPLKPKRLKRQQRLRNKLRIKTAQNARHNDEVFNHKYIPLLKSLSMLFDNILSPDTSDSFKIKRKNRKKKHYHTNELVNPECSCGSKSNPVTKKLKPRKTSITLATTFPTEVPNNIETFAFTETTTTSTDHTAASNIRGFKRNKNIPVLLTGNTSSRRRNHNGINAGGSSANYGSIERYISGDNGDNERDTGGGENASSTEYYEEHPIGTSRDYASSNRFFQRISRKRIDTRNSDVRSSAIDTVYKKENGSEEFRPIVDIPKGEDKFETGRYETKSTIPLPNIHSGLRHAVKDETETTKPTTTHKNYEESHHHVPLPDTSHKQLLDRNGANTPENKKLRRADEAITPSLPFDTITPLKNKTAMVTIFDGYSMARDVNGENKLTEKAILIHT